MKVLPLPKNHISFRQSGWYNFLDLWLIKEKTKTSIHMAVRSHGLSLLPIIKVLYDWGEIDMKKNRPL